MARIYANENSPRPVVESLRDLGHNVTTTQEAGNAGQAIPHDEVLRSATGEQRAVLTLNRKHFIKLHDPANPAHAGIVVCTYDADFPRQATRIREAVTAAGDLTGQLIRANRPIP